MKRVLIFGAFLSAYLLGTSQKPEKIYSIATVVKSESYYKKQLDLWEDEVLKDPANGEAWYNYYAASRALRNILSGDSERKMYQSLCDSISDACYTQNNDGFHANLLKYWNSGNNKADIKHLYKAYEINPDDHRTYDGLMIWGEINEGRETRRKFANKLYESGTFSSSILNWGYNMLMELPEEAILFTVGDNDTYAAWLCQDVKNIRSDVHVLNLSLLWQEDYRSMKMKELGLPEFNDKVEDYDHYHDFGKAMLDHILQKSSLDKHFTVTISDHLQNQYADSLYLTGLTYKYTNENMDNVSIIKRNYERRYMMNYIRESFSPDISQDVVDHLNTAYLPAMIKLFKHYQESENLVRMEQIKREIIIIAEKGGLQSEILTHFEDEDNYPWLSTFKNTLLDVKRLEKSFAKVSGNIFIGKYEVTNADYKLFLTNLLRSKKRETFDICIYDSTQWQTRFKDAFNGPIQDMYHWHPAYNNYPIVNISFEAAEKYCEWLTVQYNSQRKRKHDKVVFRLPTEEEWMNAATENGKGDTPWGGKSGQDAKNACYLANYKVASDNYIADGAMFTAKVGTYLENHIGAFNILGNAGEMTNEKGIAKGGSWAHPLVDCYIGTSFTYDGPDPRVGFRIVMEIIE